MFRKRQDEQRVYLGANNGVLVRQFYDADGNHKEIGEYTEEEKTLGAKFSDSSSAEALETDY